MPVPNKEMEFKPQQGEIEVRIRLFLIPKNLLDFVLLDLFHIDCPMAVGQYATMLVDV